MATLVTDDRLAEIRHKLTVSKAYDENPHAGLYPAHGGHRRWVQDVTDYLAARGVQYADHAFQWISRHIDNETTPNRKKTPVNRRLVLLDALPGFIHSLLCPGNELTIEDVRRRIVAGYYNPKTDVPDPSGFNEDCHNLKLKELGMEMQLRNAQCKQDVLFVADMTEHPKVDAVWTLANKYVENKSKLQLLEAVLDLAELVFETDHCG